MSNHTRYFLLSSAAQPQRCTSGGKKRNAKKEKKNVQVQTFLLFLIYTYFYFFSPICFPHSRTGHYLYKYSDTTFSDVSRVLALSYIFFKNFLHAYAKLKEGG